MRFDIGQTWDGEALDERERVSLEVLTIGETLTVHVDAPFHGDPLPVADVGSVHGLWEYEVVELFLLGDDERYFELELGPGGHYLALKLHGVRCPTASGLPVSFTAKVTGNRWQGRASVPRSYLPEGPLRANAYALHGQAEARRYLAFRAVKGERPDFHQLDVFEPVEI